MAHPVNVTVTVNREELWAAHTALYRVTSLTFPDGHYGGAYCQCSIARGLRAAEGRPEPSQEEVEAHVAAVHFDRSVAHVEKPR